MARGFLAPASSKNVARQERAVQVRTVRAFVPRSLVAGLTVVPEACDDATERLGAVVETRAAGVVLEAGEALPGPVAGQEDVADHPLLVGDRVQRQ